MYVDWLKQCLARTSDRIKVSHSLGKAESCIRAPISAYSGRIQLLPQNDISGMESMRKNIEVAERLSLRALQLRNEVREGCFLRLIGAMALASSWQS